MFGKGVDFDWKNTVEAGKGKSSDFEKIKEDFQKELAKQEHLKLAKSLAYDLVKDGNDIIKSLDVAENFRNHLDSRFGGQ